jgi:hypothetical protein
MFGRGKKPQSFDITDHPDVVKALAAMWDDAYSRGVADSLATAKDLRDELAGELQPLQLDALDLLIERLER